MGATDPLETWVPAHQHSIPHTAPHALAGIGPAPCTAAWFDYSLNSETEDACPTRRGDEVDFELIEVRNIVSEEQIVTMGVGVS